MKYTVVARKHLPTRSPISGGFLWYLVLDHFAVPGWAWGVYGCVIFIWACAWVFELGSQPHREPEWKP